MKFSKSKFIIPKQPGCLEKPYRDYRNVPLSACITSVSLPDEYCVFKELSSEIIIKDQNGSSSCVGHAWSSYVEVLNVIEEKKYVRLSPRFIYSQICLPGGGAYIEAGANLVVKSGVSDNIVFFTPDGVTEEQARDKNGIENAFKNALIYKSKAYGFAAPTDLETVKQAIFQGKGVVTGVRGSNDGWQTAYVRPPKTGEKIWGHAIYLIGWKVFNGKLYIMFLNSWGKGWGDKGIGYLPIEYFTDDYIFTLVSLVDLPNNWQDIINMLKTYQQKNDNRVYVELKGEYYWLAGPEMFNAGIGSLWGNWDTIIQVDALDQNKIVGAFFKGK